MTLYIHAYSLINALGRGKDEVSAALEAWRTHGTSPLDGERWTLIDGRTSPVGRVRQPLPAVAIAPYDSRNNRLLLAALADIEDEVNAAIARVGSQRVALVLGTSTSGIGEAEAAVAASERGEALPPQFDYEQQELGSPSLFLAAHLGLEGPAMTISTACSSSARAFITARRLLASGQADVALVGGADSLCGLTLNGFDSLESLSEQRCQPFAAGRDGINIGEGAALFLVSLEPAPLALLGDGESSDAWHISAPHPQGEGAERAMRMALTRAGLEAERLGYVNAHGTATRLNDEMESRALARLFSNKVPVSSTKVLTGHTLGAAGATEAALCCLLIERGLPLPPQGETADPALAPIALVQEQEPVDIIMSNSFAFGGNNVSLIFGKEAS
ncbi:beta-ketoacyl-[acyl-carrier-protein] synthase family protein [Aeromonas jandaei]|uniref:Beta-ketoacyl-[acyl-carrier-protein] synthase family protein n=1 Tax=Aeromonas jandaei TaxID=650 RepID=A0A7T4A7Q8_AERJA|nr:beta-ketoacyl-[acyl-carrier-protein] synthase family protein [Aeromonas jandaei]QQB18870.1 beta-ketoacyl-[acyl-carrier-protein] synthase family protein [Aeromonas jandaei]UCA33539.1 beta-ketoacyl-[acyl-carrier-protein] synthase family protein [Aeromonas jandaei]